MLLKSYNKSGVISWSNSKTNSHLLACGSPSIEEQNHSTLEILSVDVAQRSKQLSVLASVQYNSQFNCLAWDNFGEKQGKFPYGLIFGGMNDGSFTIWNINQMILANKGISTNNEQPAGLVHYQDPIYEYPIVCAEWNTLRPNLLAYGSNQILIVDIAKGFGDQITFSTPGKKNPHQNSYITSVAWNKEVAHILASASENGLIALWDVKTNNPIFELKQTSNLSGNRNVSISWNKKISTQIAVTYDDDSKKELQIWDLRNQKGPIVSIDKGHSRGINSMDWCDSDTQLILTSGRDNKVICWNYVRDQQIVSQMQLNQQISDVRWSKKFPSIFSVSTRSAIQIFTMNDNSLYSYVPKWYKIPVGTTMGPGNKILSYNQQHGNILTEYEFNHQDQNLSKQISELKKITTQKDYNSLISQKLYQQQFKEFWSLLNLLSTNYSESDIYDYLGLNKEKIIKQVEKYTGKKHVQQVPLNPSNNQNRIRNAINFIPVTGEEAANFFQNIRMGHPSTFNEEEEEQNNQNIKYEMVPKNFNWDLGKQKIIKQNLLIGNYSGAIDAALKCGRTAQALIISYSQGQDIFKSTLKTFFTETTDNFITDILKHISDKQNQELIKKYPLSQWKECIALIYSNAGMQKNTLLKQLSQRLITEQNNFERGLICLILAQDYIGILSLFTQRLKSSPPKSIQRKKLLLQLTIKLILIQEVFTCQIQVNRTYDNILIEASLLCFEEGQSITAYNLLQKSHNQKDQRISYLAALISQTTKQIKQKQFISPKILNLPVMQKRKEVPSKKINQNQTQQQVQKNTRNVNPNNPKINPNVNPVKSNQGQINPPPPPPNRKQNIFKPTTQETKQVKTFNPNITNPNTVNPNLQNINQNYNQTNNTNKSFQSNETTNIIPPPKKPVQNIPPPPPPSHIEKKIIQKPVNPPPPPPSYIQPKKNIELLEKKAPFQNIYKQQQQPTKNVTNNQVLINRNTPPPPPVKKIPPPPPQKIQSQQPEKEQVEQYKPPPLKQQLPPQKKTNPPPPIKKIEQPVQQVQQTQQFQQQQDYQTPVNPSYNQYNNQANNQVQFPNQNQYQNQYQNQDLSRNQNQYQNQYPNQNQNFNQNPNQNQNFNQNQYPNQNQNFNQNQQNQNFNQNQNQNQNQSTYQTPVQPPIQKRVPPPPPPRRN